MLPEISEIEHYAERPAKIRNNCFTKIINYLKLKPTKTDPRVNLENIISTLTKKF